MGGISLCQSTFSPSLAHSAAHSFRTSSGAGLGGRSTRSTGHPDVGMNALLAAKDETIEALRGEVEAWREAPFLSGTAREVAERYRPPETPAERG